MARPTNGGRRNGDSSDPTANVLALVDAEATRQDDLRKAEARRLNDLEAERRRHRIVLRELEAKFRDSQRLEDKAQVALSMQRADAIAATLAATLETTARTAAATVEATRLTLAAETAALAKTVDARFKPLEEARFQQVGGKQQAVESRDERVEQRQSNAAIYAAIGLGVTTIFLILAIATFALAHVSVTP